jgi:hypothetical protein
LASESPNDDREAVMKLSARDQLTPAAAVIKSTEIIIATE